MTGIEYVSSLRDNIAELFGYIVNNNPQAIQKNIYALYFTSPKNTDEMINILVQSYNQNKTDDIISLLNVPYIKNVFTSPEMDQAYEYMRAQALASGGGQIGVLLNMDPDAVINYVVPALGNSLQEIFTGKMKPIPADLNLPAIKVQAPQPGQFNEASHLVKIFGSMSIGLLILLLVISSIKK